MRYKLQLQLHGVKENDPPTTLHVGREWDETTHPWIDLADITMTSLLSPPATERLEFSFNNLPPSLDLLPARSVDDPNVVAHIRRDLYSFTQKLRALRRTVLVPDHVATYVIRVENGSQSATSSAPAINVSLTGKKKMKNEDVIIPILSLVLLRDKKSEMIAVSLANKVSLVSQCHP